MTKRRKTRSNTSEATTIDPPSPHLRFTNDKITNGSEDQSIRILVGKKACFRVSKHVLREIPWFSTFFSGQSEKPTYSLADDEPFALRILFVILHHKPCRLPILVTVSELVHIATACDKYGVSDVVLPHIGTQKWFDNLWEDNKPCGREWVTWVKILRVFYRVEDRCQKLSTIFDVIAANMRMEEKKWIFQWDDKHQYVSEIDCHESTLGSLDLFLERRRQDIWDGFRRNCASLQEKQLHEEYRDSDIGRLCKFLHRLPEEITTSNSVVAQLQGLRAKEVGVELGQILQDRLEYLSAA